MSAGRVIKLTFRRLPGLNRHFERATRKRLIKVVYLFGTELTDQILLGLAKMAGRRLVGEENPMSIIDQNDIEREMIDEPLKLR